MPPMKSTRTLLTALLLAPLAVLRTTTDWVA
jgi:hypothetical protein